MTEMLLPAVKTVLLRELAAVRRSVEAYPDESQLWEERPGLPNTGGTLALHLAGNLQHYLGAVFGRSGYRRHREAEFSRRDVPRRELLAELDAAALAIERGLAALGDSPGALAAPYPEPIAGREVAVGDFLVHLASHLAYHLGQLDYHRRVVTGVRDGVGAVAGAALRAWSAERAGNGVLLERRTVSRKTPGDGKLEVSPSVAERLRSVAESLEVEVGASRAPGRVETMPCTCQKVGSAHEHHFVTSELLKTLRPETDVELHLNQPDRAGERARLTVVPLGGA